VALFPIALEAFRNRVSKFPLLGRHEDAELEEALANGRSEVELYSPRAAEGLLDARLDRVAASLQSDIAIWRLRLEVERDPETGAPPKSLDILRTEIDERLKLLKQQTGAEYQRTFKMVAVDPLPPVPLPIDPGRPYL
jgi:hypothetical protein